MPDSIGAAATRLPYRAARTGMDLLQRRWRRGPLDPKTVLFESFAGQRLACNPRAIYEGMRADPRFADHRFVWVIADDDVVRRSVLSRDGRTSFVRYRSLAYFRTLARAGTVINNVTFPVSFRKRPDQMYLNTWHGTPLKKMGRDAPGDPTVLADTTANLAAADLLLSTGPYMTEVMYRGAYGITGPTVRELGYPRVDQQFDPRVRAATRRALGVGDIPLVLYAPTWRQTDDTTAADDSADLARRVRDLCDSLEPEHRVVLRLHDKALAGAERFPLLAERSAPESIGTNALLGAADVLVTDYSSVLFDFLATGSHVVLWMPDRDRYDAARGLYPVELPVDSCATVDEVAAAVRGPVDRPAMAAARARYAPRDDGAATARVLDVLAEVGGLPRKSVDLEPGP